MAMLNNQMVYIYILMLVYFYGPSIAICATCLKGGWYSRDRYQRDIQPLDP